MIYVLCATNVWYHHEEARDNDWCPETQHLYCLSWKYTWGARQMPGSLFELIRWERSQPKKTPMIEESNPSCSPELEGFHNPPVLQTPNLLSEHSSIKTSAKYPRGAIVSNPRAKPIIRYFLAFWILYSLGIGSWYRSLSRPRALVDEELPAISLFRRTIHTSWDHAQYRKCVMGTVISIKPMEAC